ncbi:MAG TPA: cytochrome c biogenesis protein CcdA [Tepidisphaeraceae bacterium]|jgi:thiol:disulfide interchange protein DsbD
MKLLARPYLLLALLILSFFALTARAQLRMPTADVSAALNYQSLPPSQQAVVAVAIDIPAGFHAQSHTPLDKQFIALDVTINPNQAIEAYAPIYPSPQIKKYPALGELSVYEGKAIIYIPVQVKKEAQPGPLKIDGTLTYQMCDDRACFPPQTPTWSIDTQIIAPGSALQPSESDLFADFDPSIFASLTPAAPKPAQRVTIWGRDLGDSLAFPFFAAFIVGIIFNVVPCVLPVVPLKIMGFYEVSRHNRARSLAFGSVFSLGIVAVFITLGLIVVVSKKLSWGELYSNPIFLLIIIAILLIFGLAQFGLFSVGLPTAIYSVTPRHDTYVGNFLFGMLTALLSTPCTFGMFLGLLIWAATQPALVAISLMTVVGLGMAFPYLVLSAIPEVARNFPRTGPWAELVKQMMGFLLIGSAVFFARRFLNQFLGEKAFWWVLFAVVAIASLYLVLRTVQFSRTLLARAVACVLALILLVPSMAFTIRQTNPPIDWRPYSAAAFDEARKAGKTVMLEFTADWCANCLTLEATTFHDKRTVRAIKEHQVVTFRADLTRQDAPGWSTLRQITPIAAIPLTAIYAPSLEQPVQLTGIYSAQELIDVLQKSKR